MKVSVLITTYNLEKYIKETLDSVLHQKTDFLFEVLIGDDGSEDGTMDIVREYQKQYPDRIRIFCMPRENGKKYNRVERSAANRLNLLKEAKGEYCTFLDGDDYYLSDERLQRMTDILELPKNRDCIMCAHNLMMVYQNGRQEKLCRAKREHKYSLKQYWRLTFLQANAIMFRNIYNSHRPTGSCARYFDDNNITFWLFQYGKMFYLPECMGAYRQVAGSSWNAIDRLQKASSNMIGYSVELEINRACRGISNIRHYPDLLYLFQHRGELGPDVCAPFYQTAEANGLAEALRIYNMQKNSVLNKLEIFFRLITGAVGFYSAKAERGIQKALGIY